jgi:cell fate regulator YaaT (PSP1 superfamily)
MPILPLPQFEADLAEEDRRLYESLKPPATIVVRFGVMRLIGEFPYDGAVKPGCGSRVVVRTHRGVELGEMLTSTCPNAGCSKSVTRREMLEYIENSGGRDYPFFTQGRVLRLATPEDLNEQARLDARRRDLLDLARRAAADLGLPIKLVEAETILSGDRVTFYFTSDDRVDFRELASRLARDCRARIDLRQVGARDEARLVADYERCGQHCCCRQFLKVLKPVSMRAAKVQKATLDPLKISGRCGRLMCCLRYEDQTYTDLQKRLPRKKWRVQTPDGPGAVVDTQILTQLVLVRLDRDGTDAAYPLEELTVLGPGGPPPVPGVPAEAGRPRRESRPGPDRPAAPPTDGEVDDDTDDDEQAETDLAVGPEPMASAHGAEGGRHDDDPRVAPSPGPAAAPARDGPPASGEGITEFGGTAMGGGRRKKRRRRRRRGPGGSPPGEGPGGPGRAPGDGGGSGNPPGP